MGLSRIFKHIFCGEWLVRRAFPAACQASIEQAIRAGEQVHGGELRFAIEGGLNGWPLLKGQTPRVRAIEVFSQLRVWDTEHNTGVLVYVLLADQAVEIVADRGIHARVGSHNWNAICQQMQGAFARGDYCAGALSGVAALNQSMCQYFPKQEERGNELPDAPVIVR